MFCLQMNQGKLIDTSPHADGLHWQLANGASSPSGSLLRRNIHTVIFRVLCTESKSILRAYLSMHNLIRLYGIWLVPVWCFPKPSWSIPFGDLKGISCTEKWGLGAELHFVFLSDEEKRRLCLNHVKPLKSLQPKLLDKSILFSLVKLVSLSASICLLINWWS